MKSHEMTQQDFDEYYNRWMMKTTSAVCRMLSMKPIVATQLIRELRGLTKNSEIYSTLERYSVPRCSSKAREFMNYWNYADSDER